MYAYGFRFYFTPLSGVLFAFPSRYWFTIGQLGVFSLGGWSPHLQTGFHVSRPTHRTQLNTLFRIRGYHPLWPAFPGPLSYNVMRYTCWALPRSLATTEGISVDFFSCRYLDVSVPRVRLPRPMYSVKGYRLASVGFPIRISPDQSLVADSPKLFAGSNVLHRLQLPRHPPYALVRLTIYRNCRPATQSQTLY